MKSPFKCGWAWIVSIAFRRLVQSSPEFQGAWITNSYQGSPLPFGVWFSRHWPSVARICTRAGFCLHCLSAFGSVVTLPFSWESTGDPDWSPLPFGVWFSRHRLWSMLVLVVGEGVSIAFRRLVQSSPELKVNKTARITAGLHCLSAFGSVVTAAVGSTLVFVVPSLHCLSAFGSVVTACGLAALGDQVGVSPLPFGVWFSRHVFGR